MVQRPRGQKGWRSPRGSRLGGTQGDGTGGADPADVTECGAATLLDQGRIAGLGNVFRAQVLHGMRMPPTRPAQLCNPTFRAPRSDAWGVLSAGRGRPARTPFGLSVQALPVVAPASTCAMCCQPLIGLRICRRVGGTSDIPVEALFPQGGERFEFGSSGWSRVLGIDAVGGRHTAISRSRAVGRSLGTAQIGSASPWQAWS
jgi:hypothetical protein